MAYRIVTNAAAGRVSVQVRPCSAKYALAKQLPFLDLNALSNSRRSALAILLSTGVLCTHWSLPEAVKAAGIAQPYIAISQAQPGRAPLPQLMAPPLASTAASTPGAAAAVVEVVEEAEELVLDVVHFFQHSVEAVESSVHHLQVVHALERLEGMPLSEVVDLELLKAAMHPATSSYGMEYDYDSEDTSSLPLREVAAAQRLDVALDSVAQWQLRDVVDVGRLADALQDVPYSGQLDSRSLQREAPRLRRAVHWGALAEAVRPPALQQALSAIGAARGGEGGASAFSELDIRAAVSAVRVEAVQAALSPGKPPQSSSRGLESSGMWTWDNM